MTDQYSVPVIMEWLDSVIACAQRLNSAAGCPEVVQTNGRMRAEISNRLHGGLPRCIFCGGKVKPSQGGACMPCIGEDDITAPNAPASQP